MPAVSPTRLFAFAVLACAACVKAPDVSRATPQPGPFNAANLATTNRANILAYADLLKFRQDPSAGDAQYLRDSAGNGPYVQVASEIGSRKISRKELGEGRIIARIVSSGPYPRLGLAAGVNYLWVDSAGSTSRRFRAVIVPRNPQAPMRAVGFRLLTAHPMDPGYGNEPLARFIVAGPAQGGSPNALRVMNSSAIWGTCWGYCCIACDSDGALDSTLQPVSDTCDAAVSSLMSRQASTLDMIPGRLAIADLQPTTPFGPPVPFRRP
jgi:hypothetical protein